MSRCWVEKGKKNRYWFLYSSNLLKSLEETEMFYFSTTVLVIFFFCSICANQNAIKFLNDRTGTCTQNVTPIRLQGILKKVFHKPDNDSDSNSMDLNINLAQINELLRKKLICYPARLIFQYSNAKTNRFT